MFVVEKFCFLRVYCGDNDDYTDVWMSKIRIKANQIDMDVCFFQKHKSHTKTMFVPELRPFPLVYLFVNLTLTDKHGTKK